MLYKKILEGEYKTPDFISKEVKDLIKKILNVDPEKRYTIEQIRRHPWYMQCSLPPAEPMETADKMQFDEDIMKQLEALQLNPARVIEALRSDTHNHLTTSYYLLLNRKRRKKEKQELRDKMYEDAKRKTETAAAAANYSKVPGQPEAAPPANGKLRSPSIPSARLNELKISGSPLTSNVPRLDLQGVRNGPLPTDSGGKPPVGRERKGSAVRQQVRQQQQPTGSQTAREQGSGSQVQPSQVQAPISARPAGPADMPDGGPVVATSPWADHNSSEERPVTRSSSRGASRQGRKPEQQRATVTQGLKGVEPPGKGGGNIGEQNALNVVPMRPAGGEGGRGTGAGGPERGGRKIKDPTSAADLNAPSTSTSTYTPPIATAVSSTSSKPIKALFNEMKKACKSRNIVLKQSDDASSVNGRVVHVHSVVCETTFSATSPLLVFTIEVTSLGEKADGRVNVCKAGLRSGKKGEFEKVCKVLFAAMKLM